MQWRKRPVIFEIHTWPWLSDLSAKYREPLTLANVPSSEWDALAGLNVDAVWLMGVWDRSPAGIAIANANPELQSEFRASLPDYQSQDNVGSAYCVREYIVAPQLGGTEGLARARQELAQRGLALILDFVPNHVAPDHPWTTTNPEYFVQGSPEDADRAPREFIRANGAVIANGRDPYFAPWPDVVQLNAFSAGLRRAVASTVNSIAAQCDGVRCDMAMLMLSDVFSRTWGDRAGPRPALEYWSELIPAVRAAHPDFIFIAEAYWDLEFDLMKLGFDYCYDKRLYDRLAHENAESVRQHLFAGVDYQDKLLRFIENHDEPRAAATFSPARERAAAVAVLTVPGAKLVYDGQLEGRKVKLPVFLARRVAETRDYELDSFYRALLTAIHDDLFHKGEWQLCERHGWPDNASFQNIVAWSWRHDTQRVLVILNLSAQRAQAMVQVPWKDLNGRTWRLSDTLNGEVFFRDGGQLNGGGLFVELDPWRFHFLTLE